MTWEEIKASDKLILTAQDVAPVLNCDPQTLRLAARQQKELIGFNCSVIGQSLRIPRLAFIRWMEGGETCGFCGSDWETVRKADCS